MRQEYILSIGTLEDICSNSVTEFLMAMTQQEKECLCSLSDRVTDIEVGLDVGEPGFPLPSMTKADRNLISSPANGLMVYQTDNTPGLRVRENGVWVRYTATADV